METLTDTTNFQFYLGMVSIVVVIMLVVYTYSLKIKIEEPQFEKLALLDDRKPAGKKRKIKEKKVVNGHATNVSDNKHEKSPSKEAKRSPTKDATAESNKSGKGKKQEVNVSKQVEKTQNKMKEPQEETKKSMKKNNEKPADFDDGNWETVYSKSDKKNKKIQEQITPVVKKEKPVNAKKEKKEESPVIDVENNKTDKKPKEKNTKEKTPEKENKTIKEKKPADKLKEIDLNVIPNEDADKSKKKTAKVAKKEETVEVPKTKKDEPTVSNKVEAGKKDKATKPESAKKEATKPESPKIETPKKEPTLPKEEIVTLKEPVKKEKKKSADIVAAENLLNAEKISETQAAAPSNIAFDELGDTWTEAKAAKKSKKKARKDN